MQITLTTSKTTVLKEIAQATAYTAAKMDNDPRAFHRIPTIEEDASALMRFWDEARSELCQALKRSIVHESMVGNVYQLVLEVSSAFDDTLVGSMEASLTSYFVYDITAKWFGYANKGEAADYANNSRSMLTDLQRKTVYKRPPQRPIH